MRRKLMWATYSFISSWFTVSGIFVTCASSLHQKSFVPLIQPNRKLYYASLLIFLHVRSQKYLASKIFFPYTYACHYFNRPNILNDKYNIHDDELYIITARLFTWGILQTSISWWYWPHLYSERAWLILYSSSSIANRSIFFKVATTEWLTSRSITFEKIKYVICVYKKKKIKIIWRIAKVRYICKFETLQIV